MDIEDLVKRQQYPFLQQSSHGRRKDKARPLVGVRTPDIGIVSWNHHYWEIWKVVNRHKSAARTDLPDGGTGNVPCRRYALSQCF